MDLRINFWIGDSENGTGNVKSTVNLVVLDLLDRENVEIPFPQRVVRAIVSTEKPPVAEGRAPSTEGG
jgi:small-conductance mechanosensitive channel